MNNLSLFLNSRIESIHAQIESSIASVNKRAQEVTAMAKTAISPVTNLVAYRPKAEDSDYLIGIYAPSPHHASFVTTGFFVAKAYVLLKIAIILSFLYAQVNFMFDDETKASIESVLKNLYDQSKVAIDTARKHFPVSINPKKGMELYEAAKEKVVKVTNEQLVPGFNSVMAKLSGDTETFPTAAN